MTPGGPPPAHAPRLGRAGTRVRGTRGRRPRRPPGPPARGVAPRGRPARTHPATPVELAARPAGARSSPRILVMLAVTLVPDAALATCSSGDRRRLQAEVAEQRQTVDRAAPREAPAGRTPPTSSCRPASACKFVRAGERAYTVIDADGRRRERRRSRARGRRGGAGGRAGRRGTARCGSPWSVADRPTGRATPHPPTRSPASSTKAP